MTDQHNAPKLKAPASRHVPLMRPPSPRPVCATFLAALVALTPPTPATSGGAVGRATEFTQLLNNAELVSLVGLETKLLNTNARQLATQANLLRTQLQAYRNMQRNTANLPETIWGDVVTSLTELRSVMASAGALASDGAALDALMKGRLIADPLFEASALSRGAFESRYNDWVALSQSALNAALGTARMTVEDVDSEAELIARITRQGQTVQGQVEALQVGNELATSIARQMAQLRLLTAAQNEQTSLFQARWMAERDAAEAARRETVRRAEEERARRAPGRNIIGSFGRGTR
ncbi:P-type conjugative transfer protein TrbJ [Ruegeria sp.]|uniref:P-type conjugative transfer protein TrbJ n=1 Tax=Ruegeria sp. TaxID=1879320 RepID=UPI003B00B8D9